MNPQLSIHFVLVSVDVTSIYYTIVLYLSHIEFVNKMHPFVVNQLYGYIYKCLFDLIVFHNTKCPNSTSMSDNNKVTPCNLT